jgi:DNA-repair protein XRCC3
MSAAVACIARESDADACVDGDHVSMHELEQRIRAPPDDIARKGRMNQSELAHFQHQHAQRWLMKRATARLAPPGAQGDSGCQPVRASDIKHDKLSLGCDVLDGLLRGGVPTGGITEIAGEASCGKTQICLQLLLQAQLPRKYGGLGGSAVYISTESSLPQDRLVQISRERSNMCGYFETVDPIACLFVEQVDDADKLGHVLRKLPDLVQRLTTTANPVRLVIIDSIAAPFRCDEDRSDALKRVPELVAHASRLKVLAGFGLAVVIINQVTDMISDDRQSDRSPAVHSGSWQMPSAASQWPPMPRHSSSRPVIPALGLSWSSCMNTRVLLTRSLGMYTPLRLSVSDFTIFRR